jgi:hypothetical protein
MTYRKLLIGVSLVMLVTSSETAAQTKSTNTAASAQLPNGQLTLGTITIPRAVLADGKPLAAGRYSVRLTANNAPAATGADATLERWVEFVQGGTVRGRELASIVPAGEEGRTMAGPDMPGRMGRSGSRVEMLKGGEYLRIWIARADHDYLIHLPQQSAAR